MVQATTPRDETRVSGFRVGESHDAPVPAGGAAPEPVKSKLPPIVWSRTDPGKIMREDLFGFTEAVTVMLLGMTALLATAMGIAIALAAGVELLGLDPSGLY